MPRTVGFLIIAMALVTGAALGNLVSMARPAALVIPETNQGSAYIVRAFYDGINAYLETGEERDITEILAPQYVEHTSASDDPLQTEDLLSRLALLRQTYPDLRLDVTGITAEAGTAIVQLSMTGAESAAGGLEIGTQLARKGQEVLRIDDGRIAERWQFWETPALYDAEIVDQISQTQTKRLELSIERLTFGPGDYMEIDNPMGFVFIVESGYVDYQQVTDSSSEAVSSVATGEAIHASDGRVVRIRSSISGSAFLLTVGTSEAPPGGGAPRDPIRDHSPGVQRRVLVADGINSTACVGQACSLHIGRLEMAPGEEIPRHQIDVAELLVMARGAVDMQISSGYAVAGRTGEEDVIVASQYDITPGAGVRVQQGAEVAYRSAGPEPAVLWIMTIEVNAEAD